VAIWAGRERSAQPNHSAISHLASRSKPAGLGCRSRAPDSARASDPRKPIGSHENRQLCAVVRLPLPPAWGGLRVLPSKFRVLAGGDRTPARSRFPLRPPGSGGLSCWCGCWPGASSGWRPTPRPCRAGFQDRFAYLRANILAQTCKMPLLWLECSYSGYLGYIGQLGSAAERRGNAKECIPAIRPASMPKLGYGDPGRHAAGGCCWNGRPPSLKHGKLILAHSSLGWGVAVAGARHSLLGSIASEGQKLARVLLRVDQMG